jgi:AcrR family transcriptional regulator
MATNARRRSIEPVLPAPAAVEAIVSRTTQRRLNRRRDVYADEVRSLLDACVELIREYGTQKSPTVSDIVEVAGLSREAFYRYYSSKEDLISSIVEAGTHNLAEYLHHQMAKEEEPVGQLRRWVEGIMAQATKPELAHITRAVLWNGRRLGDESRPEVIHAYSTVSDLIVDQLKLLGSSDPQRDADTLCRAAMGRMHQFLWAEEAPAKADVAHLVRLCTVVARSGTPTETRAVHRGTRVS